MQLLGNFDVTILVLPTTIGSVLPQAAARLSFIMVYIDPPPPRGFVQGINALVSTILKKMVVVAGDLGDCRGVVDNMREQHEDGGSYHIKLNVSNIHMPTVHDGSSRSKPAVKSPSAAQGVNLPFSVRPVGSSYCRHEAAFHNVFHLRCSWHLLLLAKKLCRGPFAGGLVHQYHGSAKWWCSAYGHHLSARGFGWRNGGLASGLVAHPHQLSYIAWGFCSALSLTYVHCCWLSS